MLLSAVTELFARVARHPAVDEALESLRRGAPSETIAGLTDPAKALIAAVVAVELRRPVLFLVETERRAQAAVEPLQFFSRVLGASSAAKGAAISSVVSLPALDALPGQGAGPHPEILETRAAALWRLASGQASIVVAPVAATLLHFADPAFYGELSSALERDQEISLDEVLTHLSRAGYTRTDLVEMPGQFAIRGGILDIFPPEAARPVRVELLGDTVESLREFDPETQRSTGPLSRVTLPPLTEFPSNVPLFSASSHTDIAVAPIPMAPGGRVARGFTLFELRDEMLVIVDEPEAIERASILSRARLLETALKADGDGDGVGQESVAPSIVPEDEWREALGRTQRLSLEQLPLQRDNVEPKTLRVQTVTRYHGQVSAFLAEVRGRVAAGEHVLITAASTGELERLTDLCREYEVPYSLGELDATVTGARLVEDTTSGSARPRWCWCAPVARRLRHSRPAPGLLWHRRPFRNLAGGGARPPTPENRQLHQQSFGAEAGMIISSTWTTASGNSRGCKRSRATAGAESSCACGTPTMRACTFHSSAWTWCRPTNRSKGPSRSWTGWAAPFGPRASPA